MVKQTPKRSLVKSGSLEKPVKGLPLPKSPQTSGAPPPPAPKPRASQLKSKIQRVQAIYNCSADNPDELSFLEGEVIVVDGEEDPEWWVGHIEGEPDRKGVFPVPFVHFFTD